jgi:hypothetical protein
MSIPVSKSGLRKYAYRPVSNRVAPGTIDHDDVTNIGTNRHADIDAHIADGTIHFTETFPGLDDLTDVTLTTPTTGGVLYKSAGDWIDTDAITIDPAGAVIVNHNGDPCITTTTAGIDIADATGGGSNVILNFNDNTGTSQFRILSAPTSTIMHTLDEGATYLWRGTPTGGGLNNLLQCDPDSDVALYHSDTDSMRTLKTGIQVLEGDNSNEPEIQFATNLATKQGTVGANHANSYFYIRAEPNSDHIRIEARSSGGVLRSIVEGDPDAQTVIYGAGTANVGVGASTLGFYGVTPVSRPSAYTQTFSTADRTHAARTAATLTDSTTGTAGQTIADVTASFSQTVLNDNFASVTDEINKLIADLADTAEVLNSVIDDLQANGLLQ